MAANVKIDTTSKHTYAVFVYSPLCGTCKLAKSMLRVMEQTFPRFEIKEVNINEKPQFAQERKVTSVPCLLLFDQDVEVERLYAFRSLEHLYHRIKPYTTVEAIHKAFSSTSTLKGD
ncbi:thioredoxin family protein [Halalkalibacterium ligniniphilum]|uniref:thioredoxin family protein n=1 Tax=Halalkalibacterium ligniniphilum TaxID=1134413 RepID=UPI0003489B8F|nr:thioredoxin family protein [Halalkalibacterium ligniniphilum]